MNGADRMQEQALAEITVVDIRAGGTVRYAQDAHDRARALRNDCLAWFPVGAGLVVPVVDWFAKRWLKRSHSPYLREIEAIAGALGFSGVWFLNGSYEWGCTTLARDEGGVPWLARTLDWPFPGLGRHVEIVRMQGEAGDFFSATWPGYVGALTAMAPGRFTGAMNQGPLWRRTRHPWLRPFDIAANAVRTWRTIRHVPPDHLLRSVFEDCRDFDAARRRLETTPIARPTIYTLTGVHAGECCVIERTEQEHATRWAQTSAANDWLERAAGWEARVGGRLLWTCSVDEAAQNSRDRRDALACWSGSLDDVLFAWVSPPVLNPFTRLAVEACAVRGVLRVVGYEIRDDGSLPAPVTTVREIAACG